MEGVREVRRELRASSCAPSRARGVRGAERSRARKVLRRQQRRRHFEQPLRVADAEGRPAADGGEAGVGQRDHPVLHLELQLLLLGLLREHCALRLRRLLVCADVLRGGDDDTDALDAGDGGEREVLPLGGRAVERRELVEHRERRLHAEQVLVADARGEHVHEHLAVLELSGERPRALDAEHLLRLAVLRERDRRRRQRRQRRRRRVRRLDRRDAAHRAAAEQVLRREVAVLAHPLLVAQPRVEAGVVRHRALGRDHRRLRVLAHPLLVLLHLLELLRDAHPALARARLPAVGGVEGAGAKLLRERERAAGRRLVAARLALPVVRRARLQVGQRVVRALDRGPRRTVAAAVGVRAHRLGLVGHAHLLRRRRRRDVEELVERRHCSCESSEPQVRRRISDPVSDHVTGFA